MDFLGARGKSTAIMYQVLITFKGTLPLFFYLILTTAPEAGCARWSLPQVHRGGKGGSKTLRNLPKDVRGKS